MLSMQIEMPYPYAFLSFSVCFLYPKGEKLEITLHVLLLEIWPSALLCLYVCICLSCGAVVHLVSSPLYRYYRHHLYNMLLELKILCFNFEMRVIRVNVFSAAAVM